MIPFLNPFNKFRVDPEQSRRVKKISVAAPLRLGLGLMYVYSGIDFLRYPNHWRGFLPGWLAATLGPVGLTDGYLLLQGISELAMGFIFLAWFLPRWLVRAAALFSALEMALILVLVGLDPITFRDIGLLGGSLTLLLVMSRQPKH